MAFVLTLLTVAVVFLGYDYFQRATCREVAPVAVVARGNLAAMERTASQVFQRASSSVVFVTTVQESTPNPFGPTTDEVGMGSGIVWDAAGHIVTNAHVLRGAQHIAVSFGKGEMHRAAVVGTAPDYDLAVLCLSGSNPQKGSIAIGSSKDLFVGQTVFAIGNPYGLTRTMTEGIVSALHRSLPTTGEREVRGVIQTDAAINPGNSGGPLLDSAGRLIGVNSAIISNSGAFAGVGFAMPVDLVKDVVTRLIRDGRVPRPGIGISALGAQAAAHLGVNGVVVAAVLPGSPAQKAGLEGIDTSTGQLGDVITQADGEQVQDIADLASVLEKVGVGNSVKLSVERQGQHRAVQVQVEDISQQPESQP
ncbi:MAG: trypsin-like peptidase domain-containing protein [Thiohalocapsa sp.]|jgi:2-alkenal reductase|uniref:S1C family serine protease n=1 Tax=Thiohalocapsa sp. TaxID=2497641 RepID=UPI0025E30283|nr:trypsin-like peptidase domain-containing protein [Thiohalocapsa sp.]MCG6940899.1 trypsin-like peptidase domain-containing protein [Thiohalocapsa sp.]